MHPRQREGVNVLEICHKGCIISSAASGEIQETKVLPKVQVRETRILVKN